MPGRIRLKRGWWIAIAAALVIVAVVVYFLYRPARVVVVRPRVEQVVQAISASGNIAGAQESVLAPEQPGVLGQVLVQEGQQVRAGQVIAQVSTPALQAELGRANAAIQTAEAQVREAQAQAAGLQEQIREAQAESERAIRQAEVRVAQARRDLARAQTLAGANATARAALDRAEAALNQADANVAAARARADNAEAAYKRGQILYQEGAISRARFEELETAWRTAQADLRQAVAQRNAAATEVRAQQQLLQTTRTERVEQAEAALEAAETDLTAAREAGPAKVRQLQQSPIAEQVATAQARLAEARQAREVVLARLEAMRVVAPYSGTIIEVISRPGDVVGPNQGVVRIAQMQRPEARVSVDERDLHLVSVGQRAILVTDAFPGRQLRGTVRRIEPAVDPQRGTVEVTIVPDEAPPWLRNGLTVDATLIVEGRKPQLVVPSTAVMRQGQRSSVLVVKDNRLQRRYVVVGTSSTAGAVILSGLSRNDLVVRDSVGLRAGQRVRPVLEER